ncbi:ABC transporter permease [Modestobacter roseus]|uniref:Peptide/nickel transport system permease protein n=1 Tax=Modestobacter roseus TaxID=1181884 RepID=A0A562IRA3_9ACTN|nr:ABC transporter permease [Modestobacter roseus]MQA33185.1 ABC transporter permease subunit [Modestobacter roseus]TWH73265.1 peptide/nickel transport system permease protein [Modestobacter roseus]
MFKYLGRKLLAGVVLTLVVTALVFCAIFANGTEIARQVLGADATPEQVADRVAALGLDQPVVLQYLEWLGDALTGDLGTSYYTGEPVLDLLLTRIPVTLALVLIAMLLTAGLSVLMGVAAAVRGGWVDRFLQVAGVLGTAVPGFIVAIALVFLFAIWLGVFPATGYVSPDQSVGGWASSLVLPVTAVLVGAVAQSAQQFRGAMIDVMGQDFVRTLRARGIPERMVVFRHALRSAGSPGLTILSLQVIQLMGGVVVIERIFALPGMGLLSQTSALQRDIPTVMGVVLFFVLVVVVVNTAVDVVNGWINPRARVS